MTSPAGAPVTGSLAATGKMRKERAFPECLANGRYPT